MAKHCFRVYVDESGDEGFVFPEPGFGSSRWFVLSAVVVRQENDLRMVRVLEGIRELLGRERKATLHFYRLNHSQRLPYLRAVAAEPLRTVSVLIHKPSIREPERFKQEGHRLYRYATRLLLERVSWLCRDHHKSPDAPPTAEVIFSNRAQMSYNKLRDYLSLLQAQSQNRSIEIDWAVVDPARIRAVEHSQLAGLQVADAVASGLFQAVNANRFGDVEPRYASLLKRTFYRGKSGRVLGYGVKPWPGTVEDLKRESPHAAGFLDLLGE